VLARSGVTCDSRGVCEPGPYDAIVTELRAAGCVYAEDEARLLIEAGGDLTGLVARRVAGEPLEWILGWAHFGTEDGDGIRVGVAPGVFVPRGRTIELALAAAELLPAYGVAVDLCCGSGAITAYLHHAVPGASYYAADVDPVAVACAAENLPFAVVVQGDLFAPLAEELRGTVDVITANTPYVPSDQVALMPVDAKDYEPLHTLDGGPDGLDLLRRISAEASFWLRPGGTLLIEIAESQYDVARTAFEKAGLITTARIDPDGTTVILGTRAAI
jgi:release factor glutamine methyltransferase